jgi:predicted enzyme involved in methoxymalonyl-ACP biosynthesis
LLSSLRKKAHARKLINPNAQVKKIRLAILGGYSLYPLHELIEHLCEVENFPVELWQGDYDNYISEIMDDDSALYAFAPNVVFMLPAERRCTYTGHLTDARELQQSEAQRVVDGVLDLARKMNEKTRAEIITTNFMLPARHDLGAFRSRTLGSDWSFRKWVNRLKRPVIPAHL